MHAIIRIGLIGLLGTFFTLQANAKPKAPGKLMVKTKWGKCCTKQKDCEGTNGICLGAPSGKNCPSKKACKIKIKVDHSGKAPSRNGGNNSGSNGNDTGNNQDNGTTSGDSGSNGNWQVCCETHADCSNVSGICLRPPAGASNCPAKACKTN